MNQMRRQEIIKIAKQVAIEQGWGWEEPIKVRRFREWLILGRLLWEVKTNADCRGCNIKVIIDNKTLSVINVFFA